MSKRPGPLFAKTIQVKRTLGISGAEVRIEVEPLPHGQARIVRAERRAKGGTNWLRWKDEEGTVASRDQLGLPEDAFDALEGAP